MSFNRFQDLLSNEDNQFEDDEILYVNSEKVPQQQLPVTNLYGKNTNQIIKSQKPNKIMSGQEQQYMNSKFNRYKFFRAFFIELLSLLMGPFVLWCMLPSEFILYWAGELVLKAAEISTFDKTLYLTKRKYLMKKNADVQQLMKKLKPTQFDIELDQKFELEMVKNGVNDPLFQIKFDTALTTAQKTALNYEQKSEQVNRLFDGKVNNKQAQSSAQQQLENKIKKGRYSGKNFCKYIIRKHTNKINKSKILNKSVITFTFVVLPISSYVIFFCYQVFYVGTYIQTNKTLNLENAVKSTTNTEVQMTDLQLADYILYSLMLIGGIVTQFYFFMGLRNNIIAALLHNKTQRYFQMCLEIQCNEESYILPTFNFFDKITVESLTTMRKLFRSFSFVEFQQLSIMMSGMLGFVIICSFTVFHYYDLSSQVQYAQQANMYVYLSQFLFTLIWAVFVIIVILMNIFMESNGHLKRTCKSLLSLSVLIGELKRKAVYYFGKNAIKSDDPLNKVLIEQVQSLTKKGNQNDQTHQQEKKLITTSLNILKLQLKEAQLTLKDEYLTIFDIFPLSRRTVIMFVAAMFGLFTTNSSLRFNLCAVTRFTCRT